MKKIFLLLMLAISINCIAQLETGLLVGGGIGNITNTSLHMNNTDAMHSLDYQFNSSIGYRFRLHPTKHQNLFYDLDIATGIKAIKFKTINTDPNNALIAIEASDLFLPLSLTASANYKIIKGLYVGAGILPSWIIIPKMSFDIPILAKIGYNINNKIEFSFNYQYSLLRSFKTELYKGGRFSEWNLSVYIPFTLGGKN